LPDENWYLKTMRLDARPDQNSARANTRRTAAAPAVPDVARNGLTLKAGEKFSGLTVSIAEGAATLQGTVIIPAGASHPGKISVFAVPAEKENVDETLRYAQTETFSDLGFRLGNLAPGRYYLLARPVENEEIKERLTRPLAWDNRQRAALRREAEAAGVMVELQPCQRRVTDYKMKKRNNGTNGNNETNGKS